MCGLVTKLVAIGMNLSSWLLKLDLSGYMFQTVFKMKHPLDKCWCERLLKLSGLQYYRLVEMFRYALLSFYN